MTTPSRAVRTYLEMRTPAALNAAVPPREDIRIEQMLECPPSFWKFLYVEIGRRYYWVDRLDWTDDDVRTYLSDPAITIWLMSVAGAPAGYFELRQHPDDSMEIAYFGLLEAFQGRGLGGHLLTDATVRAWQAGATRVWLHTSSLDHPAALSNYLKRGFSVFRTEEYVVPPRYNSTEN
jgi:ribosomal protein S18 acetylase RimI-like enzyme